MGIYETTYILHPALQEGRLNDIVNTIEKKAVSLGAEILYSDNWGRKKLAYYIDKEKYGTYIFFQYKLSDLNNLKELSGEFEHNPNVLRYLNIKIAEQDIMKAKTKESGNSEKDENSSVEEKKDNTDTEKEN
ncbi:MAG: 30S ribosomal protein S6 [Candidatus Marinimicrobia bacterium]|nr:30S ribosomal protein S6 [Candidatus Neomarinimicrobiota bacterium]|tara:strand:+ start:230 stop:625 length:396 start_codon:yes stop_codon:yes gene_type:complete